MLFCCVENSVEPGKDRRTVSTRVTSSGATTVVQDKSLPIRESSRVNDLRKGYNMYTAIALEKKGAPPKKNDLRDNLQRLAHMARSPSNSPAPPLPPSPSPLTSTASTTHSLKRRRWLLLLLQRLGLGPQRRPAGILLIHSSSFQLSLSPPPSLSLSHLAITHSLKRRRWGSSGSGALPASSSASSR